jgi:putative transposase
MLFRQGHIYHIYNQGNNREKIFLDRENYLFFLKKIRRYILPYADIFAWCLMPNHFHLMVLVKTVGVASSDTNGKKRSLNDSIGIMLRSYTNAINKQQNRTGKLFREQTKAECVNCPDEIAPSFITKNGITQINIVQPERQYPKICFDYIHKNPTKAKLVKQDIDWEFSSARDYYGNRNGKLVSKIEAKEYELI